MTNYMNGWPATWYDPAGHIHCPARHCTKVCQNSHDIQYLYNHWRDQKKKYVPDSEIQQTLTDHIILRAMFNQTSCPYCGARFDHEGRIENFRAFLKHEVEEHGAMEWGSIAGFVKLVRMGVVRNVSEEVKEAIFERLVQLLRTSPAAPGLFRYLGLDTPLVCTREQIIDCIAPAEWRFGGHEVPYWNPVRWQEFLWHLTPDPENERDVQLGWKQAWDCLRAEYGEGRL